MKQGTTPRGQGFRYELLKLQYGVPVQVKKSDGVRMVCRCRGDDCLAVVKFFAAPNLSIRSLMAGIGWKPIPYQPTPGSGNETFFECQDCQAYRAREYGTMALDGSGTPGLPGAPGLPE